MPKSTNLSVGRGEKLSVKAGGGLTAKGRAKYNKALAASSKRQLSQDLATSLSALEARTGKAREAKQPVSVGVVVESSCTT